MRRSIALLLTVALFGAPLAVNAASQTQQFAGKLQWRNIGPFIGGRVVAVDGVASKPNLFYMGGVQGGVWRSTNYGLSWDNITDGKIPGVANPIGALAVAPSNSNVIYAGTGESDIRGDFDSGDGVYKTTDAGKTWSYAGLRETHMTSDLIVDPRDPNVVYAASMGHVFKANTERGIFKTADGGKNWRKVLFVDANTGGVDLAIDPKHPDVLYAAMWQAQRVPWKLTSGGPGSGLYKSTDAGAHWTKISTNPGFATGTLGKIGVSVAASDPRVVWAIVQAHDGGVFRSTDGGATWKHVNNQMKLRQRAFYYTAIFADPVNSNVAYVPNVDALWKTTDGGKVWKELDPPHGDNHIVWINPRDPKILLEGNDGGATVSVDGGDTWSSVDNQPTGQYYHVALDDQFPFHVFGAAQDEGAFEGPSAGLFGGIQAGEWHNVALGESTFVAPQPGSPFVTYGSGYYSSFVRLDRVTGDEKNVSPWPRYMPGNASIDTKYRFGWTHPIFFSPADPQELLVAAQVVFSSMDHGATWTVLSPDLTRNDPSTEQATGGPVDNDQTGAETFPDIASLAVSPMDKNVLWAGSADGLVHVTTDHGAHWNAVTPPQLPQWAQISSIEPSHTDKGSAYLTANRYMWDDFHPYVYSTTDYGAHWTAMSNGIPPDQYVFAIKQDPREPRLLFAGTRSTVYVSYNAGGNWENLTLNLPGVQVRDLAIDQRQGSLVAATHGRAFWILDNLALLEQLAAKNYSTADVQLFAPETAWLSNAFGAPSFPIPNLGQNPQYGATIFYNLPPGYNGKTPLSLTFLDSKGDTVRAFTLHPENKHAKKLDPDQEAELDTTQARARSIDRATVAKAGMNVFQWNLRYSPASDPPGFRPSPTDDWADTAEGPTILPGAYTAVLQYGDKKLQVPVTVKLDPRITPAAGDLEARLTLERKIIGTIDALDRSVTAALAARAKLPASKRADLDREVAALVQFDIHSSEADVLHPTKTREQLAFLLNSLENSFSAPTSAEYATYDDLKAEADAGAAKLTALGQ